MTIITAKVFGAVGLLTGAGGATLAIIEPATQTALIGVASLAVTSVTAIILAWIAYKQSVLSKKQDALAGVVADVKKQTDGITSKLVDTEARASLAEGELKGKADAQVRQDKIDISIKAVQVEPAVITLKAIEQHTADTAAGVQDLKDKT